MKKIKKPHRGRSNANTRYFLSDDLKVSENERKNFQKIEACGIKSASKIVDVMLRVAQ